MFDALCNIAWEWFWLSSVGKTAYCFFYFHLKKNRNVNEKSNVLLGAVGKAKTTGAVGERWGERVWDYLIGWSLSIAVFKAFNPVCRYFSVVSGLLCPAKCCTTRKSLFLVSKLAITLCLMVVAVSFFLNCF
jgi:hypothetical protein